MDAFEKQKIKTLIANQVAHSNFLMRVQERLDALETLERRLETVEQAVENLSTTKVEHGRVLAAMEMLLRPKVAGGGDECRPAN